MSEQGDEHFDNHAEEQAAEESPPTEDKQTDADGDAEDPEQAQESAEVTPEENQQVSEEQPQEATEEPPQESTEEQPQESTEEPPQEVTEEPPKEVTKEPPQEATEDQPQEPEEQPQETSEEQPQDKTEDQPQETTEEPPQETMEEPPQEPEEQPQETAEQQPQETTGEQPQETLEQPEDTAEHPQEAEPEENSPEEGTAPVESEPTEQAGEEETTEQPSEDHGNQLEEPPSEQQEASEQPESSGQPAAQSDLSEQQEAQSEQPEPEGQSEQPTAPSEQQEAQSEQPTAPSEQQDVPSEQPEVPSVQTAQEAGGELEEQTGGQNIETDNIGTGTEPAEMADVDPHAPTPEAMYNRDATATVKVNLMPSGQVTTLRCLLSQTMTELKEHFSSEHKLPIDVLLLMCEGNKLDNNSTVADLGVGPNGTIQLELQSGDPVNQPIKILKPRQEYTMPDVITVRVPSGNAHKDIVVEIERLTTKKPFLGGYRHKDTSIEYHHASSQTMQKPVVVSNVERFCRDTQTSQQKHNTQQTTNNTSTQMTGIGVYMSNLEDKLVTPGKYTTADDFHSSILYKVVIIQKYYRRWLAQRYVTKVKEDKEERERWEIEEELKKKQEKENRIRHEYERRMNPKSKQDFDLLYHALEKWRQEEVDRIDSALTGAERKAALCQLLDQETQLIASIGRHKIDADDENKKKSIQNFLDKTASPKTWKGPDGRKTEMDTPYTIRAQELKDIYNSINMKYLTQDERLDALLTLKHTVKEHDCKLTQEILELIDREAELLMRGVKESNLEGLRKRISTLYLQYIKTPTFNPEAARLLKVPQDPSTLRKDIYFCPSCSQYKASTEFRLSSNSRAVGKCRKCLNTDNDARVRQDYSHYRYMLKEIRRSEQDFGDESKIAFLLQESDLRHLVENVWSAQSALSAWSDLYDLTLVRWDRFEHWSPWNCVLLTKEEASAHEKLQNMDEAYEKKFVLKVQNRHTLAKKHFSRLPNMADHMKSRAVSEASRAPSILGKGLTSAQAARA